MANGRIDYSVKMCAIVKIMCSWLALRIQRPFSIDTHGADFRNDPLPSLERPISAPDWVPYPL